MQKTGIRFWGVLLVALALALVMIPVSGAFADEEYADWTSDSSLPSSGTYRLTTNVTVTSETTIGSWASERPETPKKALVLDLNGYTITAEGTEVFYVQSTGGLTIEDRQGTGKITNEGSSSSDDLIYVGGSFTMNGGTLEDYTRHGCALFLNSDAKGLLTEGTIVNYSGSNQAVFVNSNADFTMEGGKVINETGYTEAIYVNTNATFTMTDGIVEQKYSDYAISNNGSGKMEISGGEIISQGGGIEAYSAPILITGGEIDTQGYTFFVRYLEIAPEKDEDLVINSASSVVYSLSDSPITISGGVISAPSLCAEYTANDNTTLEISGGQFTVDAVRENEGDSNTEITIYGGTYQNSQGAVVEVDNYTAPGVTQDENGNVVLDKTTTVAIVDGKPYVTLAEAIAALEDDSVMEILPGEWDVTTYRENDSATYGSNFIIDKDGVTIKAYDETDKPVLYGFSNKYSGGVGDEGINGQDTIYVSGSDVTLENLVIMPLGGQGAITFDTQKTVEVAAGATGFSMTGCETLPNTMGENSMASRSGLIHVSTNDATIEGNTFGTETTVCSGWDGASADYTQPLGFFVLDVSGNTWADQDIASHTDGIVVVDDVVYVNHAVALQQAVNDAELSGKTITLTKNLALASPLEISQDVKIDGANHTLTCAADGIAIKADLDSLSIANLTISGEPLAEGEKVVEGIGTNMGLGTYGAYWGVADLDLYNVTIENFNYGIYFGKDPANSLPVDQLNNNPVSITAEKLTVQDCYVKGVYGEKFTETSFTECKFLNNGNNPDLIDDSCAFLKPYLCGVDINLKRGQYEDISFIDCVFEGNGANDGTALLIKARDDKDLAGEEPTSLVGVTVDGCEFINNNEVNSQGEPMGPIILGEPGKDNKSPINVSIQPDVKVSSNLDTAAVVIVTFDSNGGEPEFAPMYVGVDKSFNLPAAPERDGYTFEGWSNGKKSFDAGEEISVDKATEFVAQWKFIPNVGGNDNGSEYKISTTIDGNGSVAVTPKWADKGDDVTIIVNPDQGYELDDLTVKDKDGDTIRVKDEGDNRYTFTMPNGRVYVEVSFKATAEAGESLFSDVAVGAYYYDSVQWAVKQGVTTGATATTFAPDRTCTRAEAVTFLWRAAGMPQPSNANNPFTDIDASDYYYNAVLWAVEKGITTGASTTTFSPDQTCIRGEIVTFLYRLDGTPALTSTENPFLDVEESDYNYNAVLWALAEKVTNGTSTTTFSPDKACSRGEIVTFLYNYYMGE